MIGFEYFEDGANNNRSDFVNVGEVIEEYEEAIEGIGEDERGTGRNEVAYERHAGRSEMFGRMVMRQEEKSLRSGVMPSLA